MVWESAWRWLAADGKHGCVWQSSEEHFTLQTESPEAKKKKLNAELANGRLAMMAIIGMRLDCFYERSCRNSS